MSSIDYGSFRKRMIGAACRGKLEDTLRLTSALESEIIIGINDLLNGFGRVEAIAIVAALDRYKSLVMDVVAQSGESRALLQSSADQLNEATHITYVKLMNETEVKLDDD